MRQANLRVLPGGMAFTRSDLPNVASRLQINAIYRTAMFLCLAKQMSERIPVIAPFLVIANAGAEFIVADFAAQPFVQKILIAAEGHLQRQHYRTVALRQLADQRRGKVLRRGKRMIV